MDGHKFKHRAMLDYFRPGKMRVVCTCGKHSPVLVDFQDDDYNEGYVLTKEEQGRAWALSHTGLREVQPTKRSAS